MPWNEVGKEVWNESPGVQGVEKNKERKKRTYRIHCLDDHRTSLEAGCYSKLKFDLRRPPPRRSKILGERFPFPLKDDDPRLPVSIERLLGTNDVGLRFLACPRATCRARDPNPRHCRVSVINRWAGEQQSMTRSLASPPIVSCNMCVSLVLR